MHPLFGHLQGKEDFKLKSFALAAEWLNFQLFSGWDSLLLGVKCLNLFEQISTFA